MGRRLAGPGIVRPARRLARRRPHQSIELQRTTSVPVHFERDERIETSERSSLEVPQVRPGLCQPKSEPLLRTIRVGEPFRAKGTGCPRIVRGFHRALATIRTHDGLAREDAHCLPGPHVICSDFCATILPDRPLRLGAPRRESEVPSDRYDFAAKPRASFPSQRARGLGCRIREVRQRGVCGWSTETSRGIAQPIPIATRPMNPGAPRTVAPCMR